MRYSIFIIIILIYLASPENALAEAKRYRVELLVLRHLDSEAQIQLTEDLRDFSGALDLLTPPPPEDEAAEEADLPVSPPAQSTTQPSGSEPGQIGLDEELAEPEPEPPAVLQETPGEIMQLAWRRLRLSAGFRPEAYFSWEQSDEEPFPLIRVHDMELLFEEDPWAEERAERRGESGGESEAVAVFTDTGKTLPPEPEPLPEPLRFYRIDGTASFRKSRFLHLDLDIEFREAVAQAPPGALLPEAVPVDEESVAQSWNVQVIRQSRPVQTREMEYFDGPVIGILALISRVAADAAEDDLTEEADQSP